VARRTGADSRAAADSLPAAPARTLARRLAPPALLLAVGAGLTRWSWGTWPDPVIDFGRELYLPWRLAEGEVLYRDLAHLNGPFSAYFNALLFRVFGVGLTTLVAANLALLALITFLLYWLLRRATGPLAATAGCLTLLLVFSFSQYFGCANYNYVAPYAHEMTHGLLWALAALALFLRAQHPAAPADGPAPPTASRERRRSGGRSLGLVAASGCCLGLAWLTKAEILLALCGGLVGAAILRAGAERPPAAARWPRLGWFLLGAAAPVGVACVLLGAAGGSASAWHGALGAWLPLFGVSSLDFPFYRDVMGIADPGASLLKIGLSAAAYAAFLAGVLLVCGRAARAAPLRSTALALAVVPLAAYAVFLARGRIPLESIALPLPLFLLLLLATDVRRLRGAKGEERERRRTRAVLCVVSLLLLAKVALNVRVQHYGFVLAMPGAVVLVATALHEIPRRLRERGGNARLALALLCGGWIGLCAIFLAKSNAYFGIKGHVVSAGRDRFVSEARGRYVGAALAQIGERLQPGASFVVLPEGVMVNYLARRPSPTRFVSFMPLETALYGEDAMLAALEAHPPDAVLLLHRNTAEYGARFFGTDYGTRLMAWVRERYRSVWLEGEPPFRDGTRFGAELLLRRR